MVPGAPAPGTSPAVDTVPPSDTVPASGPVQHGAPSRSGHGDVRTVELANNAGMAVSLSSHGARVLAVKCPDREGRVDDVVLGFDTIDEYVAHASLYFGCTVGRVANRIAGSSFAIGSEQFPLAANEGPHHLHGGSLRSLDKVVWSCEPGVDPARSVTFRYLSPHLEEGYPGVLTATTTYSLADENELRIDYVASADRPTPVDLTNHVYWNLHGDGTGTVLDHELVLDADLYAPTDEALIPIGPLVMVDGGPLDFRTAHAIGERIASMRATPARGYDHSFILRPVDGLRHAATVRDRCTGRALDLWATQPALQLYTGNRLPTITGKGGRRYGLFGGMCLEPEHVPDALHHPQFPPIVLEPGSTYRQTTIFRMSVN